MADVTPANQKMKKKNKQTKKKKTQKNKYKKLQAC